MLEERFNEKMQIKDTLIEKSVKIIVKATIKRVLSHGKYFIAMQKTREW